MSDPADHLFRDATPRDLSPGEVIFRAGDPVRHLYRVAMGEVRLLRMTGAGTEIAVQHARAGTVLAEASLFSDSTHCEARATGPARVLVQPVVLVRDRLRGDAALALDWARHLGAGLQAVRTQAAIRAMPRADDRLAAWLAEGHSLPVRGHWQDLAADLGLTREALYRALSRHRRRGQAMLTHPRR